jgi:benzoyl-CoA reductase/2-hydroxyglutaryl-CoA dehydratase subunit BcrC/BadD/HgdB
VLPLYLPRRDDEAGIAFLAQELGALYQRLVEITDFEPGEKRLLEAVLREEGADAWVARLHCERSNLGLDDRALYRLIRSREYLPAETFSGLAAGALEGPPGDQRRGVPVILSGIVPEPGAIFDVIADAGGVVAADDLACCGRRLYPPGSGDDPFVRLARTLLGGPPDSTRGVAVQDRIDHLCALTERSGARAVVFLIVKFCEPELFYLPLVRAGLESAGIRSVTLEVDIGDQLPSQATTQVQALLETL